MDLSEMDDIKEVIERMTKETAQREPDPEPVKRTYDDCLKISESKLRGYGFDDTDSGNFKVIAAYLAKLIQGEMTKGVCICGNTGRGKTFALECMSKIKSMSVMNACTLVSEYQDDRKLLEYFRHRSGYQGYSDECVIDDIGSERMVVDYGDRFELVTEIIIRRDIMYRRSGIRTHFTTNLTKQQIGERYGDRVLSRLQGMCVFVTFKGDDRRLDK